MPFYAKTSFCPPLKNAFPKIIITFASVKGKVVSTAARIATCTCMLAMTACTDTDSTGQPDIEVMNAYTPVKDQGDNPTCWAYAMLAAIETEHIMKGDSVNLSPKYALRALISDSPPTMRGTAYTLIRTVQKHGIVPYDAYPDRGNVDYTRLLQMASPENTGNLDIALGPAPKGTYMYGMKYSPQEFARSVCAPDEYIGLTTDTQQPYHTMITPDIPDNYAQDQYYNIPQDEMIATIDNAVIQGHGVCWEGRAKLTRNNRDSHAMAIVGLARDSSGKRLYIMKNSWGQKSGFIYVQEKDIRQHTDAVYLPKKCTDIGKVCRRQSFFHKNTCTEQ